MTLTQKTLGIATIAAAMFVTAFVFLSVQEAEANPSNYVYAPTTATTSLTYMTPGTATTTKIFDTEANVSKNAADNVRLLVQFTASSTSSTLAWRYEYSQDLSCKVNPTAADWYMGDWTNLGTVASTTQASPSVLTSGPYENKWTFASTTPAAGAVTASVNRGLKIVEVPVYTKCVRVSFYLPIGSTNGAVWADFVARKENL